MPRLLVISGSVHAGKSTVSELLVSLLPRAAHVSGDALRHFVTRLPLGESIPLTLRNIISVSSNFLAAGFDVVIDYPLSKSDYTCLSDALSGEATATYAFILSPRLEVAQNQRGDRVLSAREVERIAYHYRTSLHNPGFGVLIDNSDQTPEETASTILGSVQSGRP